MPLEETDGLQPGDRVIARRDDAMLRVGPGCWAACWMDSAGQWTTARRCAPPRPILYTARLRSRWTANTSSSRSLPAFAPSRPAALRQRPAHGNFRRQRRRQKHVAGRHVAPQRADVTVIALMGERNREVRAFLENELGPEGRSRSVVVWQHRTGPRRCAFAPASWRWRSPNIFAIRARTCC